MAKIITKSAIAATVTTAIGAAGVLYRTRGFDENDGSPMAIDGKAAAKIAGISLGVGLVAGVVTSGAQALLRKFSKPKAVVLATPTAAE